jgi:hypothetical protein
MRQISPLQTFTASAAGITQPVITFALNGVGGSGTLASIFDQYKIDAIRCTVRPNNNALDLRNPSTDSLVPLYWVIDYNDATVLAATSSALEYDNCMVLSPGESATRTICPKYALTARSVAGTDTVADSGAWLASASDDILHYGFKFFIPQASVGQTLLQTWLVEVEYFLTFRQVS